MNDDDECTDMALNYPIKCDSIKLYSKYSVKQATSSRICKSTM